MGRHSKFNSSLTEKITSLYETGATDEQVAKAIGVSVRTIYNWKGTNTEFMQAIKESKDAADGLVEASLFSRATGYSHPETKVFVFEGMPIKVKVIKHYPPDVSAGIFWLCNRQPDRWRRNTSMPELSAATSSPPVVNQKSFEEFCTAAHYFTPFEKQNEMRQFGLDETETRLLLGARGYGKTDFVTIMGTAYDIYKANLLGKEMDLFTNLIITKSKSRCSALVEEIKNALEKNGVALDKANATTIRVKGLVGQDHSVEAITIKTSMRGRHPKRILMDDPVTDEDVSESMRATVKRRYDEAYKLCSNICIIGQPAHFDDLYANLRGIIKTMEVPHGQIPELDADLHAMKIAGIDPDSIEMSYHLRVPKAGSAIFSNLLYVDQFPAGESVCMIDPSDGGDYTAISVMKGYFNGIAVQGHAWKKAWYHCLDDMLPIFQALNVKKICFETNATGNQPLIQLRQLLEPMGIGVVGKFSTTDKHAAIQSAGSYSHLIHLSRSSDKVYSDQVTKYEYKAKHDDAPDSLARGMEWLGLIRGK